jgi:hypothetical protein
MALVKGTNSYVTVEEADSYFVDRLDVAAWSAADATSKAQALVTAASILDELSWVGTAIDELQDLAFPRSAEYFDPKVGAFIVLDAATPTRILTANKELAYHLLNNDGLQDSTGSVKNISVGPISLTSVTAPNLIPHNVKRMIKPLLQNAGSNSWWRAN